MKVKRIDKELPLVKYATGGSVGLDCFVREDVTVPPHGWALIPLNIIVEAPEGTFVGVLPRSSTFKRTGLLLANSLGVVDPDYCGEEDEIMACVYNTTNEDVYIMRGEKLFQLVVFKVETPCIEEVSSMKEVSRGGFGSTDKTEEESLI